MVWITSKEHQSSEPQQGFILFLHSAADYGKQRKQIRQTYKKLLSLRRNEDTEPYKKPCEDAFGASARKEQNELVKFGLWLSFFTHQIKNNRQLREKYLQWW